MIEVHTSLVRTRSVLCNTTPVLTRVPSTDYLLTTLLYFYTTRPSFEITRPNNSLIVLERTYIYRSISGTLTGPHKKFNLTKVLLKRRNYKETLPKGPANLVPVSESSTYQDSTYRPATVVTTKIKRRCKVKLLARNLPHTKLMLLFSGHSFPFRCLFNFLMWRNARTTTLIGNGN